MTKGKKVDHVIKNGQELKWCPKCGGYRPLSEFHTTNGRTWDNLFWLCKFHANERRNKSRTINASHVWRNIQIRVAEHPRYRNKGIQVRMTRDEFIEWYIKNWFEGCMVDRIDNNGHYEIGNLQLLNRQEHNHKARNDNLSDIGIVEPDGLRYCYTCKEFKPFTEFYQRKYKKSKFNPLGLNECCKDCCRRLRREYYKENKQ